MRWFPQHITYKQHVFAWLEDRIYAKYIFAFDFWTLRSFFRVFVDTIIQKGANGKITASKKNNLFEIKVKWIDLIFVKSIKFMSTLLSRADL